MSDYPEDFDPFDSPFDGPVTGLLALAFSPDGGASRADSGHPSSGVAVASTTGDAEGGDTKPRVTHGHTTSRNQKVRSATEHAREQNHIVEGFQQEAIGLFRERGLIMTEQDALTWIKKGITTTHISHALTFAERKGKLGDARYTAAILHRWANDPSVYCPPAADRKGAGARWSYTEEQQLVGWVEDRFPIREISNQLHRSQSAVRARLKQLTPGRDDLHFTYGVYPHREQPWESLRRICRGRTRTPWNGSYENCIDTARPLEFLCDQHAGQLDRVRTEIRVERRRIQPAPRAKTFAEMRAEWGQ